MYPWEMVNKINRYTKLINFARRFIEKKNINGKEYFFRSKEEALIIDMVGHDYSVNLGAERAWTETEKTVSTSKPQTIFSVDVNELQMLLEVTKNLYFKDDFDEDAGYWVGDKDYISHSAAVILAERMKEDEEFLYETKNKVLYIANALGELQKFEPHKTESGKWRYSVRWRGIPFHLPATTEDSKKFEKKYSNVDRTFPVKTEWKVPDLHLQEIMADAWGLYIFIDNHLSLLDGYEEFRSRQVF